MSEEHRDYDQESYDRYHLQKSLPKLPTDLVKITAVVSRAERDQFNEKAKLADMNASAFLSRLIAGATINMGVAAQIREMNSWLGRINSNLNMLAKATNIYKDKTDVDLIIFNIGVIRNAVTAATDIGRAEALKQGIDPFKRRKPRTQRRKPKEKTEVTV